MGQKGILVSAKDLFAKYDMPVPRYTSYPTVPYWENNIDTGSWIKSVRQTLADSSAAWSMYLHVPYCESLCTFCGCNTVITKDHKKELAYIQMIHREWELYRTQVPALLQRPLKHLHLGGGTPTFLSSENLKLLLSPLLKEVKTDSNSFEASIEIDPRRTSKDQLQSLFDLGFRRVSMGVQDFNPEVQRLVNRIQPFEMTQELVNASRSIGYTSVNFDLIYGLAGQTSKSFESTIDLTISLMPDRIALYSFALVPWIKPQHRLFKDEDLPTGAAKRALYEMARKKLLDFGYAEIGIDHFALKRDGLHEALINKKLHRNFMGYTDHKTDLLLGLGVSSISESPDHFHQNEKLLPVYEESLNQAKIPTHRGHFLNETDSHSRQKILQLITGFQVDLSPDEVTDAHEFLKELILDQIVRIEGSQLLVTEIGKPFIRNICVLFDKRMREKNPQQKVFSSSI